MQLWLIGLCCARFSVEGWVRLKITIPLNTDQALIKLGPQVIVLQTSPLYEGVRLSFQIFLCLMSIQALKACEVSRLLSSLFYAFFFSKATIPLINTIWPWTLFQAPSTCRTPIADGFTKSSPSQARRTLLVTLKWWQGRESSACPLTKPDVVMEGRQWTQPWWALEVKEEEKPEKTTACS